MISGNIDTDRQILLQMEDKELLKNCALNKYFQTQVCNENFWKDRTEKKQLNRNKPSHISWKDWYALNSAQLLEPHLYTINVEPSTLEKEAIELLQSVPLRRGDIISMKHPNYENSYAFIVNTHPLEWERIYEGDYYDFVFPMKSTKIIEKTGLDRYRKIFMDLIEIDETMIIIRLTHRFLDDYFMMKKNGEMIPVLKPTSGLIYN